MANQTNIKAWSDISDDDVSAFGDIGDLSRQYILNPAINSIISPVQNKTILDAGCGNGYLSRQLARKGATVFGVEPSEKMFEYCLEIESEKNDGITYLKEDLSNLSINNPKFDIVIANMVIQDVYDYESAISNCISVLKPQGIFIFSILHPIWEFKSERSYFEEYSIKQRIGVSYHRTIQDYVDVIRSKSGIIARIIEPQPTEEAKEIKELQEDFIRPNFMIFVVKKFIDN